jgi:hypothetical protein
VHVDDKKVLKVKNDFLKITSPRAKKYSRRRISSPRVSRVALGKEFFAESQ